jgi:hypothetical protein
MVDQDLRKGQSWNGMAFGLLVVLHRRNLRPCK